jgi:hypothetical protein
MADALPRKPQAKDLARQSASWATLIKEQKITAD